MGMGGIGKICEFDTSTLNFNYFQILTIFETLLRGFKFGHPTIRAVYDYGVKYGKIYEHDKVLKVSKEFCCTLQWQKLQAEWRHKTLDLQTLGGIPRDAQTLPSQLLKNDIKCVLQQTTQHVWFAQIHV